MVGKNVNGQWQCPPKLWKVFCRLLSMESAEKISRQSAGHPMTDSASNPPSDCDRQCNSGRQRSKHRWENQIDLTSSASWPALEASAEVFMLHLEEGW